MHFHRPISVILEKQVSASILSGLYSFLSATHPAHPFLQCFHLLPPSSSTIFRRSLINTPEHWCWPRDPELESPALPYWASELLSHRSHPGLSAGGLDPLPPQGQGLADIGAQNNRGPFLSASPWTPPCVVPLRIDWLCSNISKSINFIHLMQMRQTWEFIHGFQFLIDNRRPYM